MESILHGACGVAWSLKMVQNKVEVAAPLTSTELAAAVSAQAGTRMLRVNSVPGVASSTVMVVVTSGSLGKPDSWLMVAPCTHRKRTTERADERGGGRVGGTGVSREMGNPDQSGTGIQ